MLDSVGDEDDGLEGEGRGEVSSTQFDATWGQEKE